MYTEQLSQALSIPAAGLDPVSQGIATVVTGGVNMGLFERVMYLLKVGAVGGAGTVDAKLQSSNLVAGTYTDIAGSDITQIIAANKSATLEIRAEQMPKNRPFLRLSVTVGGNAVLIAAETLAGEATHKPASQNDIAAVTQRLVV